ncbi:LOW QUALITY PROTEIN: UCH domain-containing protein, partial [Cephalotus follicularis]
SKPKNLSSCSSGKCQIMHWRQGHKDQCRPQIGSNQNEEGSNFCFDGSPERHLLDDFGDMPATRSSVKKLKHTKLPTPESIDVTRVRMLHKSKSSCTIDEVDVKALLPKGKTVMSDYIQTGKPGNKEASAKNLGMDASHLRRLPSSSCLRSDHVHDNVEDDSRIMKGKNVRSVSFSAVDHLSPIPGVHMVTGSNSVLPAKVSGIPSFPKGARNALEKVITFAYEPFIKLYCHDEVILRPFGLTNCGNSCYANAVLQCLVFTPPLTSYLVRGLHSKACRKKDWCFLCEFESLILKGREGNSPLSPINILSKIKIGTHLGQGREEDAHEFLRYAVDTMQSVCLKEAGATGALAEETTIKCTKCHGKSELYERMMDLTVEIDGDIGSLQEALAQFTGSETLDRENKYRCSRCKSYEKAKKLTIMEAPNILTIMLKRFQSGNFGKLNKSVRFPEVLNIAPYMSGTSDKSPVYSLYAVIVHLDVMNATFSGHYVCYVKNILGEWFRINDSVVIAVELERVLLEEAYMLFYARHSPRAPSNPVTNGGRTKKRNLQAVPSSLRAIKTESNSNVSNMVASMAQRKHGNYPNWLIEDGHTSNHLLDSDGYRFHAMQRVADSSSESSSLFSGSDASSCSTASTTRTEDLSDYIFGEGGRNWCSDYGLGSDLVLSS